MEDKIEFSSISAKEFISRVSMSGRYALYIFYKSLEKNIAFDRQIVPKKFDLQDDYFYGFLVACFGMKIINFNFKEKVITATDMNNIVKEEIVNYFSIAQDDKRKKAIDEYFS